MKALIDTFLSATEDGHSSSSAAELYKDLFGSIPEYAAKRHVLVVPDGELGFIPFDALVDPDGQYALQTHVISYAPSATVLYLLHTGRRAQPKVPLLAIGSCNPLEAKRISYGRAAHGLFDPHSPLHIGKLPSLAGEVQVVTKIIGYRLGELLGPKASEEQFKDSDPGRYRVIHIASHGFADQTFPERSGLLLGFDAQNREDGLLQVREIRELRLRADLITRSACDAGAGRMQGQNGIASIFQAFLFAGGKSIVASLWTADDTFTAALMARFYQALVSGSSVGDALRSAKLQMIDRFGANAAPLLWAGFLVSGDPATTVSFTRNYELSTRN